MDSLNDLYNRIKGTGGYEGFNPLQRLLASKPVFYVAPEKPKKTQITPEDVGYHIMQLESDLGASPNTPSMNRVRQYTIPAANQNEPNRTETYTVGYGGWGGITPAAMGQYHKSAFDYNAPKASSTEYGLPLIPGKATSTTQEMLKSKEGTQKLISDMFQTFRKNKKDFTPEGLTNDYMDYWVGVNNPKSYTQENRARVLNYFTNVLNELQKQK